MTAKEYAIRKHRFVNHFYDNHEYEYHLQIVVDVAEQFKHLIPENDYQTVVDACWCHDLIEDTRETYNDVLKATNKKVAEIVYALTNEKGKNRAERANDKYYRGIRETPLATFVKLCDRIANTKYSGEKGSSMIDAYRKENKKFVSQLYQSHYEEMFQEIEKLLL